MFVVTCVHKIIFVIWDIAQKIQLKQHAQAFSHSNGGH